MTKFKRTKYKCDRMQKRQNTNLTIYKKTKYKYDITKKDTKRIWQNTTIIFPFCLVITWLHFVIFVLCLFVLCHICILSFVRFDVTDFFYFPRHGPNLWKLPSSAPIGRAIAGFNFSFSVQQTGRPANPI